MRTTTLDVSQWLICTAVALSIAVAAVPRPSLRQQHRALTGPRPLDNGSCFTFPAAGRDCWPGRPPRPVLGDPGLTSWFIIVDSI